MGEGKAHREAPILFLRIGETELLTQITGRSTIRQARLPVHRFRVHGPYTGQGGVETRVEGLES
jgi:hypothetical protein